MPVSEALRRLLRIRDLEEEQQRLALDAAVSELRRLELAYISARARERAGRGQIAQGVTSGDGTDRVAGMVEVGAARRHAKVLQPRIAAAEGEAARLREQFLVKRVERRQAETLIREAEALDAVEAGRRAQQRLDDWHGARVHGRGAEERGRTDRPDGEKVEVKKGESFGAVPEKEIKSQL